MNAKNLVLGLAAAAALVANAGEKIISSSDTLVFMGDSITEFGKRRSHGYVNLVVKGLAANGITPTWHGVGIQGNTAAQMLARFDTDVIAKKPTVVTISAGVNDTYQNRTFAEFYQDELDMVAKVKKAGAKCMMLSPTTHGFNPEDVVTDPLYQFVNGVKKIAADENLAYARTHENFMAWSQDPDSPKLFGGKKATCTDGVHMSPAGDRQMARAVLTGFGLSNDELSTAEAAWNADTTLVPLVHQDEETTAWSVNLTAAEAQTVSGQTLGAVLARGAASLAADPSSEEEASGASSVLTISKASDHIGYKTYDQLIIAACELGVDVQTVIKYAILRGARNGAALAPSAPVAVVNAVGTGTKTATFDATISSVGVTAGSCDVFLKLGTSASALGASERVVVGESASFEYCQKGLNPNTTYHYELTFVNNATTPLSCVVRGSFTTQSSGVIDPSADDDTATIQAAIDAAVPTKGTVTLAGGVFNVYRELMVTGGVKLVGQDMTKTTIRQFARTRVLTLNGGSRLERVTVTGGKASGNWTSGGGVQVKDGAVSSCRIRYNQAGYSGSNVWGGGVFFENGSIDHSVIAFNKVSGASSGGGAIGWRYTGSTVSVDDCLIYGNVAPDGPGGAIRIESGNPSFTVRNTTITGNSAKSAGGVSFDAGAKNVKFVNDIVAGNTATSGDADLTGTLASGSSNNVIGGTPAFADAANHDYHLAGSYTAAIGKGVTYSGIGTDLDGVAFANPPSVGCYEYSGTPSVAKPTISPAGSAFYPSIQVTLACATDGATIRYTLDGSDPTESSAAYSAAITLTKTTTVKAKAYQTDLNPSEIVSATYTYEEPVAPEPPVLGTVAVTPKSTSAALSGSIASLGNNGATACDVYFALNGGVATKVVSGATGAFTHAISGLSPETAYTYTLSISNNASVVMGAATSGGFTTTAKPTGLDPVPGNAAATRQLIQDAIDEAAPSAGTVALNEGLFLIDDQLMVTGGVTLVGQGWEKTVIKNAATVTYLTTKRCVTIDGGAKVQGVTLTGGNIPGKWGDGGAGANVKDGTISWCCISNNVANNGGSVHGGGVYINKGTIDHSIIAFNTGNIGTGGGISGHWDWGKFVGPVVIDTCLIYGNTVTSGDGGGLGFSGDGGMKIQIRNTTITGNSCSSGGGGLSCVKYELVNSIVAGNTSASGAANVSGTSLATSSNFLVDVTPDFVDAAKGDFHLKSTWTDAIGKGVTYAGIGVDLDKVAFAATPSLGCYEYVGGEPTLPAYIQGKSQDVVNKYTAWAKTYGADTASAHEASFLLNCGISAADLATAKAAFKIVSIGYDDLADKWVCAVTGKVAEGEAYGNGYVHFVSVKDRFPGAVSSSDFFKAILAYAPANGLE